ncbi:hypothetical protein [Afifella aestuarii]|uniref:hypothetical protein n=1 Tax=Afifella aestuarii TaxID=1909496 RepID=UPI000FE35BDF|nr:hypothetical protein [Afifella aestuarii]
MAEPTQDLTTIAHVYGPSQTSLAICMLKAHGIVVVPVGQQHISVAWHYSVALGGVALRVPSSQAEDAQEILKGFGAPVRRFNLIAAAFMVLAFLLAGVAVPPRALYLTERRTSSGELLS